MGNWFQENVPLNYVTKCCHNLAGIQSTLFSFLVLGMYIVHSFLLYKLHHINRDSLQLDITLILLRMWIIVYRGTSVKYPNVLQLRLDTLSPIITAQKIHCNFNWSSYNYDQSFAAFRITRQLCKYNVVQQYSGSLSSSCVKRYGFLSNNSSTWCNDQAHAQIYSEGNSNKLSYYKFVRFVRVVRVVQFREGNNCNLKVDKDWGSTGLLNLNQLPFPVVFVRTRVFQFGLFHIRNYLNIQIRIHF